MVQGVVNADLEATVMLSASGLSGQTQVAEVVIDTGFSEYLILDTEFAKELQLEAVGVDRLMLADGTVGTFEVYLVMVEWDNETRGIEAYAAEGTALVGMSLLHGDRLVVDVVEGGRVEIQPRS